MEAGGQSRARGLPPHRQSPAPARQGGGAARGARAAASAERLGVPRPPASLRSMGKFGQSLPSAPPEGHRIAEPPFGRERQGGGMRARLKKREPKWGGGPSTPVRRGALPPPRGKSFPAEAGRAGTQRTSEERALCAGCAWWLRVLFPLEPQREPPQGPRRTCPGSKGAAEKPSFGARRAENSGRATGLETISAPGEEPPRARPGHPKRSALSRGLLSRRSPPARDQPDQTGPPSPPALGPLAGPEPAIRMGGGGVSASAFSSSLCQAKPSGLGGLGVEGLAGDADALCASRWTDPRSSKAA